MRVSFHHIFWLSLIIVFVSAGCVSRKRKGDVGKVGKFYHNTTSYYNGYFNANELYEGAVATLEDGHTDNFSQIIPVFPTIASDQNKAVAPELDKVVEKVTKVAIIHEAGDWVDDCYVMMGKAQFLKKDFETAEETFEYFQEEFNPSNPYGKGFKKKSAKQLKKEREKARKEQQKERDEAKKAQEKERKEAREAQDQAKEEAKEQRERERKEKEEARKREREAQKKAREEERKNAKKNRGKSSRSRRTESKAEPTTKTDTTQQQTTTDQQPTESTKPIAPAPKVEKEEPEPRSKPEKPEEPLDKTAYSEGLLYLAKTYIERQNYSSAEFILKNLEKKNVQDHVRREIAPTLAHLFISQKEYMKAIPYLEEAIETADRKKDKARYAYIIGQI